MLSSFYLECESHYTGLAPAVQEKNKQRNSILESALEVYQRKKCLQYREELPKI